MEMVTRGKRRDWGCAALGLALACACSPEESQPSDGPPQPDASSECGAGFEAAPGAGCRPILPSADCEPGELAIVGEERCHEIAPCGDEAFGTIPVETTTQFVDAAYSSGASDGSRNRPWTALADGLSAAAPGAIVALAAGSYALASPDVDKPVRLWGRCPRLVEIVGTAPDVPALRVMPPATGTEIHALAIRGNGSPALMVATNARLTQLWVHDSHEVGVGIRGLNGLINVELSDSLVEYTVGLGIGVADANVTLDRVAVRDSGAHENGAGGILGGNYEAATERPRVTIRQSYFARNAAYGVALLGVDLSVDGVVVSETREGIDGRGDGLVVASEAADRLAAADLSSVFVASSARAGLANFAAAVAMTNVSLECNPIQLNGESTVVDFVHEFNFFDQGGNRCGCGATTEDCAVQSANLEPPGALP